MSSVPWSKSGCCILRCFYRISMGDCQTLLSNVNGKDLKKSRRTPELFVVDFWRRDAHFHASLRQTREQILEMSEGRNLKPKLRPPRCGMCAGRAKLR